MSADPRERHALAKQLFERALELPTADRRPFVQGACGADAALCDDVLGLLAADAAADTDFLDGAAIARATAPDASTLGLDRGWRVLRELGRGGMGVVFLAERADGAYEAQVALKLLAPAAAPDDEAVLRLKLERQILARLNHPNIARLLDGGTAANGVPYLVMEYVEGQRLDHWCAAHALDLDARIDIFLAVCDAVAYAHRNLVVHRDIKPNNILVTADGTPKLLDFGIARLVGEDTGLTGTAGAPLTPRYASPEQVRGEPASTLADVYSLGVVLYELLTDASPYGAAVSAPLALPRVILEEEPSRPSVSVTTGRAVEAAGEATERRLRIARRLRGDLDAIVLKTLRKVPAERYASVEALAADLVAHRAGLPVGARRGERAYRARKFVRRHWLALASLAGLAVLVAGFVVSLARQLEATERERDRAEHMTTFLLDLFRNADPRETRGRTVTLRDVLDRGATRLPRAFGDREALGVEPALVLAEVYGQLAEYDRAVAMADRAVDWSRAAGERSLLHRRALVRRGIALQNKGDLPAAIAALTDVQARSDAAGDVRQSAEIDNQLGALYESDTDHATAQRRHEAAEAKLLALLQAPTFAAAAQLRPDATNRPLLELFARNAHNLCNTLKNLGHYDAALARCTAVQALKARLWPPDHPAHLTTMTSLAMIHARRGDMAAATAMDRELLERSEAIFGPEHPETARAATNLGIDLKQQRQYDAAMGLYQRALAALEKAYGAEHRSVLDARNNIANLELQRGNVAAGLAQHEALLAVRRRLLPAGDMDIARSLLNLASAQEEAGLLDVALANAREALVSYERHLGADHPDTLSLVTGIGAMVLASGDTAAAHAAAERAIAAFERRDEPDNGDLAAARFLAARALWSDPAARARALTLARQALATAEKLGPNESIEAADVANWLSERAGTR